MTSPESRPRPAAEAFGASTGSGKGFGYKVPSPRVAHGLWLAWAALLAFAMVWGNVSGHGTLAATWGRMGASLALVVAAWAGFRSWRSTGAGRFMGLVALGMTLGTLGDFFNADLLTRIVPLPDPVLGGMASFGLGHIAYIAACLNAANQGHLRDARAKYMWLAAWLLVATLGWYAVVYVGASEKTRDLVWPALPYSLLLASTAGLATGLAAQNRQFRPFAIGAALFFISDMLLAVGLFRGNLPYSTELVWLTYSPGQMLIVFGALMVCPLLTNYDVATGAAPHRAGAGG